MKIISQNSFFTSWTFVRFQGHRVDVRLVFMLRELRIRSIFLKASNHNHRIQCTKVQSYVSNKFFSFWLICYIKTDILKHLLLYFIMSIANRTWYSHLFKQCIGMSIEAIFKMDMKWIIFTWISTIYCMSKNRLKI